MMIARRTYVWLGAATALVVGMAVFAWRIGMQSTGGVREHPMIVKTDIPAAVAVGTDGAVWFTIEFSDAIGVFRDGKLARLPKGSPNIEPLGLAADASGGAWFADAPSRAISHIAGDGSVQSYQLSSPVVRLGRLAVAPDGAVWFADITTASITRLQDGIFTRHDVGALGGSPYGVVLDADGTIWSTLQGADRLARIGTDGNVTAVDVPTRASGLGDLAVDRSGAVWFLEIRANKIGRFGAGGFAEFAIPTPSSNPVAIAAAPDGSVWFTEISAGKLGRLHDGSITEFRLPRADARPFGVAVDAANNVWYTDLGGHLGMLPADRATAR
jgi:virginiamycin B lyase